MKRRKSVKLKAGRDPVYWSLITDYFLNMDILAHSLYGITVCSRTGLAGGRTGAGVRAIKDRTVWQALFFSLFPDMVSMWVPFILYFYDRIHGNFFHEFTENNLILYRYMHSLVMSLGAAGLLAVFCRAWAVPALAWTVHLLCDAFTHNAGKFRTTLFYPFSDWGFDGFAFWMDFRVFIIYWSILPVIWFILWRMRREYRRQ